MKSNQLTTAWAMIFIAFSLYGCQKQTQSPAGQTSQTETGLSTEADANSANQAAGETHQPKAATQDNVPNTESGADAACGLGGTLSEDMCVCGKIRYSQAEASQWTCLGDQVRCLQHDGCSLFRKKYPVGSDMCDADKTAVNDYPCSERWKCDAESCNCHQITIHSGDVCVPGGMLAPNNGIYETQDDYNNRTSRCGGKHIADIFIAKEEDVLCKDGNWLCLTESDDDDDDCKFWIKDLYYDLQKQSWVCEPQPKSIVDESESDESESKKDKNALYCAGQPMPGVEIDKSAYACIDHKWVCKTKSCSCRTSMRMDDAAYSQIGNQKVCDLSGIIPNYKNMQKVHNQYNACKYRYNHVTLSLFEDETEIVCKNRENCRCPNGYVKNFIGDICESEYDEYSCVKKEPACHSGKIYDSKSQTCVCPEDSVYNSQLDRCEFFKCQNGKCKDDFTKTCLTDIHACIEDCPKGYVYDISEHKCRKYKEKCNNKIDDLEKIASISCDFAARHGYDYGYGNDASWDQTFDWFDEECAEDNDEDDDEFMENSNHAAEDNAAAPSVDKSTNDNGEIPKGMRLGPCYDTVYYGYGTHNGCGDGGYYNIGKTVRCVSANGCSCGESTCQKYGQCIDGQCQYDDFYLDLMCYAKDSFVGDWYDDDGYNTFPITADHEGNCTCNHTILNPGFNYKKEYLCSQYGWLCIKDTGCRCGEIQCDPGSVCIAPGQCSQPVVPCSGRLSPRGDCCENGIIDKYDSCCKTGILDRYDTCCKSGITDKNNVCCESGIRDSEGTCCVNGIDKTGECCSNTLIEGECCYWTSGQYECKSGAICKYNKDLGKHECTHNSQANP